MTVEDVSDAADVSPRTFFNYFSSKEAAILNVDPARPAQMRARLEARPAEEPPLEALRIALTEASATLTEDAEAWALKMRLVREHPSLFPHYLAAYADAERGLIEVVAARVGAEPNVDLYPSLIVAAALNATRVTVHHWVSTNRSTSLPVLIRSAFDQLGAGLTPPRKPSLAATRSTRTP